MKILNYNQFINLKEETLYCETLPVWFGELGIKKESIIENNDWFLIPLLPQFDSELSLEKCYEKLEKGESLKIDLTTSERDAMYDNSRKFLIYEQEDLKIIINKLQSLVKEEII